MTRDFLITGLCLLILAPSVLAKGDKTAATFQSHVEEVQVPVVVLDKDGNFLPGLKKEDFTIREEGREQPVASIQEIETVAGQVVPSAPPGYPYSNITSASSGRLRLTTVVVDLADISLFWRWEVRKTLLLFLAWHLPENEALQFVVIGDKGLELIHPATWDPKILRMALNWSVVHKDPPCASTDPALLPIPVSSPAFPEFVDEARRLLRLQRELQHPAPPKRRSIARGMATLAVEQFANSLFGIPGRKAVIWISESAPGFGWENMYWEFQPYRVDNAVFGRGPAGRQSKDWGEFANARFRTWCALRDANVAIYHLHAPVLTDSNWGPLKLDDDFAEYLHQSGGRVCFRDKDVRGCFQAAIADSSRYYQLTYKATRKRSYLGWREIRVRVKRKDARVLARAGYFDGKKTVLRKRGEEIDVAMVSPAEYTAVPVAVGITPGTAVPEARQYTLSVNVPTGGFTISDGGVELDMVVGAIFEDGRFEHLLAQTISADLSETDLPAVLREGLRFSREIRVPAKPTIRSKDSEAAADLKALKIVVRDRNSDRIGSVGIRLSATGEATLTRLTSGCDPLVSLAGCGRHLTD